MKSRMSQEPAKHNLRVVIPIVAGVGNALMAVPMVRRLKRGRPDARITVIARIDAMAEPFRRMSEVDEVLVTGTGLAGLWRKFRRTRECRADVYLVPFPSNRWQYNLLALLSGARRRIMHSFPVGYWRSMGWAPSDRVEAVRGIHDVQQNLRLLTALGIDPEPAEAPRFDVNPQDRARADELLRSIGIGPDSPFLAIHAGSARTLLGRAKRWPVTKYAELIALLRTQLPLPIVLLEGPDEAGVAAEILEACRARGESSGTVPMALHLHGPLGDAAAVLERAELYIGSDSGLAHLAAAVGTRAVTIFAPADPDRVCPFGCRELVVRPQKSCSPCFQYPWDSPYPKLRCREPMCVNEVSVEQVLSAVQRAIEGAPTVLAQKEHA